MTARTRHDPLDGERLERIPGDPPLADRRSALRAGLLALGAAALPTAVPRAALAAATAPPRRAAWPDDHRGAPLTDLPQTPSMLPLSSDDTFHFELLRVLSTARYAGADVGEVLQAAATIRPGDFGSWHDAFFALAERVAADARGWDPVRRAASVSDAMFRAASYYRAADFFLHGRADDPRIASLWAAQTACFDRAIALLPVPGQRLTIQAAGFRIPAIWYAADRDGAPRPTLLLCNGYDGSQEEMLHTCGLAALERGFNVLTFEGPGQPTVRREQGLGFIAEWEHVVTPVLDRCAALSGVDVRRIALLGYSFGGYLAPRAAAFEHRLAAVVCVDGVYDVHASFAGALPPPLRQLLEAGRADAFNAAVDHGMRGSTQLRWAVEQGRWSFAVDSAFDLIARARPMTLAGIADRVRCPVLVCEAEHDRFFAGQPAQLAAALGARATYHRFTDRDAAGEHCHVGASAHMNQVVLDWLQDVVPDVVDAGRS